MGKANANYRNGADLIDLWRDDVLTGQAPVLYPAGTGELARIEFGPGLVALIGGAPGVGKTALVLQMVIDAMRMTPTLRVVVCNVEMKPQALLDRQLARLSGVALDDIRYRKLGAEHADRIDQALATLEALGERLTFLGPPYDLSNIAATCDAVGGDLILLDYIQRIPPPGKHGDRRGALDATMSYLRQFADAGAATIIVSALGRSRDKRGRSTYDGDALNLASFRESSELEFGCDDAFILTQDKGQENRSVVLRHLKSRHGETRDIPLAFDGALQRFGPAGPRPHIRAESKGKLTAALAALWSRTEIASEEDDAK